MPRFLSLPIVGLLLLAQGTFAADPSPAEAAIVKRLQLMDATVTRDSAGQVSHVQFGCGSLLRDDDVALLAAFPKLERLNIIGADDITDAGLEHLKGLKVKRLYIMSEKLTVKSADILATLTDLEFLELKDVPVTGEWLAKLRTLPSLNTLKIRGAELKDADAKEFAGFPKLATVQIRATKMTNAGLDAIRTALPKAAVDR